MIFFCVTPCLNAEKFIEQTILSVLSQTIFDNDANQLYYNICDGGSTDKTIQIIEQVLAKFSGKKNISVSYYSKKDNGMYDALANGFESGPDADIYSYINADDYYAPNAFEIVAEIFANHQVYFLCGLNCSYNQKGHLINAKMPFDYNKNLLQKGLYGKVLNFVQQESTFWSKRVHQSIEYDQLRAFRYAGDYYLWKTFIEHVPLFVVSAWLGGFRINKGQLSERFIVEYLQEMNTLALNATPLDYLNAYIHKFVSYLPIKVRRPFTSRTLEYDHSLQKYELSNRRSKPI